MKAQKKVFLYNGARLTLNQLIQFWKESHDK